jgi:hypothetical protein
MNNNNSNYQHHPTHMPSSAYASTYTNGFRPINNHYSSSDAYHSYPDGEYLRHRAQSTSSTTSSDSVNPIRLIHQRLPPTMTRSNAPQKASATCESNSIGSSGENSSI